MPDAEQPWVHVTTEALELDVPPDMIPSGEQAIEGQAAVIEGAGLRVTIDASPFADPLTGHRSHPGFRSWSESIDGEPRPVIAFPATGGHVFAVRLAGVTVTIHVAEGAADDRALRVLRSVRSR